MTADHEPQNSKIYEAQGTVLITYKFINVNQGYP